MDQDNQMQAATFTLKASITDCEKTSGKKKSPGQETRVETSQDISKVKVHRWYAKPGKSDFLDFKKQQSWFWQGQFDGTIPDTVEARWQFKTDILDQFWIDKVDTRARNQMMWSDALDIIAGEVDLLDPPIKRCNRFLKAKQNSNEEMSNWIERVYKLGEACKYTDMTPELLRMLIIYIGVLEGKVKDDITKEMENDLTEKLC